ncbi:MAG: ATP-binding cassette domain-containing protein, partial [Thermoleophilaceae bacterium]
MTVATNDTSVKLASISKRYGDVHAVRSLDLEIGRGEFFTLLGPSGCGKTTILRCIAGLETTDQGSISIAGRFVSNPSAGLHVPSYRRPIGMVFQSYAIWPHRT